MTQKFPVPNMESWTTLQMKNLSDDFPTHVFFPSKTNIRIWWHLCHAAMPSFIRKNMFWKVRKWFEPPCCCCFQGQFLGTNIDISHRNSNRSTQRLQIQLYPAIVIPAIPGIHWTLRLSVVVAIPSPNDQRSPGCRVLSMRSRTFLWRAPPGGHGVSETWKTNGFVPKSAMNFSTFWRHFCVFYCQRIPINGYYSIWYLYIFMGYHDI